MPKYVHFPDARPPVCGFPGPDGPCQATPTHGLLTGPTQEVSARLCDDHISEGHRQLKNQHPKLVIISRHLSGTQTATGKNLPIVVKEYPSLYLYQLDAPRMANLGYIVLTAAPVKQSPGCGAIVTLGLLSLLVPREEHYVVTYRLDRNG